MPSAAGFKRPGLECVHCQTICGVARVRAGRGRRTTRSVSGNVPSLPPRGQIPAISHRHRGGGLVFRGSCRIKIGRSTMTQPTFKVRINPAFHRFPHEATIIGRLLASFGEIEYLIALCAAHAHDNAQHRVSDAEGLYRLRTTSSRIDAADVSMRPAFEDVGLAEAYGICRTPSNTPYALGTSSLIVTGLATLTGACSSQILKRRPKPTPDGIIAGATLMSLSWRLMRRISLMPRIGCSFSIANWACGQSAK